MTTSRWLLLVFLGGAVACAAGLWLQREAGAALRSEVQLLHEENARIAALRAENDRLRAAQVPESELQRLRADRAALGRLRAEIEGLRTRAEEMARAESAAPPAVVSIAPETKRVPARSWTLALEKDGGLKLGGREIDLDAFRRQLALVPRGEFVEVRVQFAGRVEPAVVEHTRRIEAALKQAAREFGLRFELLLEQPSFDVIGARKDVPAH